MFVGDLLPFLPLVLVQLVSLLLARIPQYPAYPPSTIYSCANAIASYIATMSMSIEDASAPREPRPVPETLENVLDQFNMRGKVVAVTGASDGIGYAVAEAIAEAGGDIVLWYNTNNAAIDKGRKLAEKHGIRAKAYQVEVSDPENVQKAISATINDFGKLDVSARALTQRM